MTSGGCGSVAIHPSRSAVVSRFADQSFVGRLYAASETRNKYVAARSGLSGDDSAILLIFGGGVSPTYNLLRMSLPTLLGIVVFTCITHVRAMPTDSGELRDLGSLPYRDRSAKASRQLRSKVRCAIKFRRDKGLWRPAICVRVVEADDARKSLRTFTISFHAPERFEHIRVSLNTLVRASSTTRWFSRSLPLPEPSRTMDGVNRRAFSGPGRTKDATPANRPKRARRIYD